jgi:cell division initiation protein
MEGRLKISPLDIRTQEFKKSFRGYDPDEVRAFLELIAGEWEVLIKDFAEYREKMNKLESSVTDFQEMEQTLKGILLTAQKSSEEAKKNAAKEAELLVKEAEVKSSRILEEAKRRIFELRREIEDLSNLKESFLIKMKSMLDTQQYLLESFLAEEKKEPELTRFKRKADLSEEEVEKIAKEYEKEQGMKKDAQTFSEDEISKKNLS